MSRYSGYCKHGTYVGGCGIDWMCGSCESGDPDITPAEIRACITSELANLELVTLIYEDIAVSYPQFVGSIPELTQRERASIASWRRALTEALRWARHENDDDWLTTRYDAEMEAA